MARARRERRDMNGRSVGSEGAGRIGRAERSHKLTAVLGYWSRASVRIGSLHLWSDPR